MPWLVGVDDWLASYGATEKMELDTISTEERLRQLFAVYGCNGTEFSYPFLQNNGILNGETVTEERQRNVGNHMALPVYVCLFVSLSLFAGFLKKLSTVFYEIFRDVGRGPWTK